MKFESEELFCFSDLSLFGGVDWKEESGLKGDDSKERKQRVDGNSGKVREEEVGNQSRGGVVECAGARDWILSLLVCSYPVFRRLTPPHTHTLAHTQSERLRRRVGCEVRGARSEGSGLLYCTADC